MESIVSEGRNVIDRYALTNRSGDVRIRQTYTLLKENLRLNSEDVTLERTSAPRRQRKNGFLVSSSVPNISSLPSSGSEQKMKTAVINESVPVKILKRASFLETRDEKRRHPRAVKIVSRRRDSSEDSADSLDELIDLKTSGSPPHKRVIFNVGNDDDNNGSTKSGSAKDRNTSYVRRKTNIAASNFQALRPQPSDATPHRPRITRKAESFPKLPKSILKKGSNGELATSMNGATEISLDWAELAQLSDSEDEVDPEICVTRRSFSPEETTPRFTLPSVRRTQSLTAAVPVPSYDKKDRMIKRNSLYSLFSCSKDFAAVLDKIVLSSDDENESGRKEIDVLTP